MAVEQPPSRQQTAVWLRAVSGELATATVKRLEDKLSWYRHMSPGRRSAVGLIAQAGIASFISWFEDPNSTPLIGSDVFGDAPRELLRSVSLQQTLQLLRVTVAVVEERAQDGGSTLREAILLYSRETAFAAADLYARAAEARGLWDARLEALIVDTILSGESSAELPRRAATLGWRGNGPVAVLVGSAPQRLDMDQIRRAVREYSVDVLVGVHGQRLVLVMGRSDLHAPGTPHPAASGNTRVVVTASESKFLDIAVALERCFGPEHLILGHEVPGLVDATQSARAALAGFAVADSWPAIPRPAYADDLLPERALAGDPVARETLQHRVYQPLHKHSPDLTETLRSYLENGRSLEATARDLFIHPNTVRYRLRKISEVSGWDPGTPRDALILHAALIIGSMNSQLVAEIPQDLAN